METFTLNMGRCTIIRAFGGNPLVRTSDQVEALMFALASAIVLIAAPVAGGLATAVHDARAESYAEQLRDRRPVTATVTDDATEMIERGRLVVTAPARWRVDSVDHVKTITVDEQTEVGDPVEIWVDGHGNHAAPPITARQAGIDAVVVGTASWLAVVGGVAVLSACLRAGLTRRRAAAWDRELPMVIDDAGGRTGTQT